MKCLSCGLENPPSAQYCDCGHEFVPGSKPRNSAPAQPSGTWCPKCKTYNPASNEFCGKCGARMKTKTSPALTGCLGLIAIAVLFGVFSRSCNSVKVPEGSDKAEAWTEAEEFVKKRLVAPGSAEFSGLSETSLIETSPGHWVVNGWVDAQNAFGAKLRRRYKCKLRYIGARQWEAEEVSIE